jgi:predicted transcriptional regulator
MFDPSSLVREARRRAGITQAELAHRLSVKQPVIARLERRGANPRLATLLRAVEATGHGIDARLAPLSAGPDEAMIAANMRLEPSERLRRFAAAYRSVSAMARKAKRANGS